MNHMDSSQIRKVFLDFFKERGHSIVPSSSLVPENDPTTLFVGSGMQPLIQYFFGASHPEGKRIANSQKSFRAEDINEVGDNRHTTFFEMLGNWSLGDYFKEQQLPWIFEFFTDKENGVGLDPRNLYVTVFAGDKEANIPADDESVGIWKKLFAEKGIDANYVVLNSEEHAGKVGMQDGRIFSYDVRKNWWSRSGIPAKMPAGEPGGPDSEIFFDFDPTGALHDKKFGEHCHPNCDCGRFLEIGNSVFMEYKKKEDGSFEKLLQRNVDFGGGLERITAAANNNSDVFKVDVLWRAINKLNELNLEREYDDAHSLDKKSFRIIADHIRACVFLIADGVLPGNKGRNYIVRRLIRRAIWQAGQSEMGEKSLSEIADIFMTEYENVYPDILEKREVIINAIFEEEKKFKLTLSEGTKQLRDILTAAIQGERRIKGEDLANLFTTYGFPLEVSLEGIEDFFNEGGIIPDGLSEEDRRETQRQLKKIFNKEEVIAEFNAQIHEHQELSRTSSAGIFKGGLADTSERTLRLHTAHHLLLRALQMVLGPQAKQRGSNITSERLRMDFSYGEKMTDEQKKEVEKIVNEKIAEDLPVIRSEMAKEEAEKLGAEHEFGQKYPDRVSVYSIGPKSATQDNPQFNEAFSIEFCGGPHVAHTGEVGHFKIAKEESVAAGVRRIRGIVD
jgi:alanyl-tRNA synthetase